MESYPATLWRNNNVFFPPEVSEKLGVRPGGKMSFIINDDGRITVEKGVASCG